MQKNGRQHVKVIPIDISKRRIPNPTKPTDTDGYQRIPADTAETDKDKDKDSDYDLDNDNDYDSDKDCEEEKDSDNDEDMSLNLNKVEAVPTTYTATYNVPQYTFKQIDIIAQAVDEESAGDYPYVTRLVRRFYEINSERNWCGTDGKPIADIVKWYKQYLDYEMDNGYQMKSVAACEE